MTPQKIKTFLWYDGAAEEAANLYCSLFADSGILGITHYPEGGMAPAGTVMTVAFRLAGIEFVALNGGPMFRFTEAISLSVDCVDQAEVDFLWESLIADGGSPSQCGWLKDRWGLSWQIVPRALMELMSSTEPGVSLRVVGAMMQMSKIDVAALQRAAAGR